MLHVKQKPEGYLLSQAESTFAKFAQTKLSWIWGSFTSPGVNLSCQQIRDRVLDYTNCLMTDCRLTECSGRTIRKAEGGGWFLARKNFFSGRWPVQEFSFFFWVQPFVGFFFAEWRIIWRKIVAVIFASSSFHGFITNQLNDQFQEPLLPVPNWLVSLIGRALHRYRRDQGFESRTSLTYFFSGFLFATAKVAYVTWSSFK